MPVYCVNRVGPKLVTEAYQRLAEHLKLDAVVLVDGGTDSLMRGDEEGIGTPVEDVSSIAAVDVLPVPVKLLVCLGFGVDAFHEVCHAHVLEAVADLTRAGGFLGAFSLTIDMPEVRDFRAAAEYVLERTPDRQSIVLTSVLAALEGRYGDYHVTERTSGSELYINALMTFYWCFRLDAVARRILYLDRIRHLGGFLETDVTIEAFRNGLGALRPARPLPM